MIIPGIHNQGFTNSNQSFKSMFCKDERAFDLMISCKEQCLDYLEQTIKEQRENPVDIIFRSKYGVLLTATLSSIFSIKNFKEHYIQKPIIESSISFIKRVVQQANEYKAQIAKEAKLHPEPFLQHRDLRRKELIKRLINKDT